MEGVTADRSHQADVDEWLARAIDHGSSAEIVRLFHAALEAIWARAVVTLGTVTLTAIAERVLHNTTEHYAFFSVVRAKPNGDARWREHLLERLTSVPRADLIEGLRFGLIELLAVIGTLTAEILRDDLHAALQAVAAAPSDTVDRPRVALALETASKKVQP